MNRAWKFLAHPATQVVWFTVLAFTAGLRGSVLATGMMAWIAGMSFGVWTERLPRYPERLPSRKASDV